MLMKINGEIIDRISDMLALKAVGNLQIRLMLSSIDIATLLVMVMREDSLPILPVLMESTPEKLIPNISEEIR